MKKTLLAVLCVVVLVSMLTGVFLFSRQEEEIEGAGTSLNAPVIPTALTRGDAEYPMKRHLRTVLLIGTDSTEEYEEVPEEEQDLYSFHQADFLMLLAVDQDSQTVQTIQLNRDTMAEVPWLDILGRYGGTLSAQLCTAFRYGDGGPSSCRNTVDAVSSLLFDAPIDAYIQLPMSAIPQLNDLVGGVTVTIEEDMTAVDPAFVQGRTLTLTGEQAKRFVRARMALEDDTNTSRMRRQRQYMNAFRAQAEGKVHNDKRFLLHFLNELSGTMQTNLTANQLSDFAEELSVFEIGEIRTPEGELRRGTRFYEFYVDEASLWELVLSAYCG